MSCKICRTVVIVFFILRQYVYIKFTTLHNIVHGYFDMWKDFGWMCLSKNILLASHREKQQRILFVSSSSHLYSSTIFYDLKNTEKFSILKTLVMDIFSKIHKSYINYEIASWSILTETSKLYLLCFSFQFIILYSYTKYFINLSI